jgi:AcrR family transcriptional regulator
LEDTTNVPTPARTSTDEIVAAGRRILEVDGLDALTMQAVARAVGVRPPSLYKRVRGRDDLVRRISTEAALELAAGLEAAARSGDPRSDLRAMAVVHRGFARASPRTYALLFAPVPAAWRIDDGLNARVSAPLLRAAAAAAGPEQGLEAARLLVAWAHGFVSMELAGAFRLGGDVDMAFDYGIDRLIASLEVAPQASA